MKYKIIISTAALAMLGIAGAPAQAADASALLNKANVINYEEIQMAKTAKSKAGDNQARPPLRRPWKRIIKPMKKL